MNKYLEDILQLTRYNRVQNERQKHCIFQRSRIERTESNLLADVSVRKCRKKTDGRNCH